MSGQGLTPPPSEWPQYYHSESATARHREGERGEGERERGREGERGGRGGERGREGRERGGREGEGERGEGERERGRVRGYKVQNPGSAGVHEQGEQRGGGGA